MTFVSLSFEAGVTVVSMATESPARDYRYLDDNPDNPVSESTLHFKWGRMIAFAAEDTRAGTEDLVTGNVIFNPDDTTARTAPDVTIIPGLRGREFRCYRPGPGEPVPSVAIEIRSRSKTQADIERRARLLLGLGVGEFYVVDPERSTVQRAQLDNDALGFADATGQHSDALGMMFVRTANGTLGLCCPGDRVVTIDDNPYSLLRLETHRADAALTRALAAETRAEQAQATAERLAALLAEHGIDPEGV